MTFHNVIIPIKLVWKKYENNYYHIFRKSFLQITKKISFCINIVLEKWRVMMNLKKLILKIVRVIALIILW